MTVPVLDAHALLVYLEREDGFETVREWFSRALSLGEALPMTVVNLGEVLYVVRREHGAAKAEEIEQAARTLPIELVDVDLVLTRDAARFKAAGGISYADSFAAALASQRKAGLLTGDPEFRAVEGEIGVEWLSSPHAADPTPPPSPR